MEKNPEPMEIDASEDKEISKEGSSAYDEEMSEDEEDANDEDSQDQKLTLEEEVDSMRRAKLEYH